MSFNNFSCYYHVTYACQSESTPIYLPECQGIRCSKQARYLNYIWKNFAMSLIYLKIDCIMMYMKIVCIIVLYMKIHSPFVEIFHF